MPKAGELIALGMPDSLAKVASVFSLKTGITAAGTVITDATDLAHEVNIISTAAASTGVQLPNFPIGSMVYVRNSGANTVNVFPASSTQTINGGSAGAAVTLATTKNAIGFRETATNWVWTAID